MAYPPAPKPVGVADDGMLLYDFGAFVLWAKRGAEAYADARAQGLACVDFYRGLQSKEGSK